MNLAMDYAYENRQKMMARYILRFRLQKNVYNAGLSDMIKMEIITMIPYQLLSKV